MFARDDSVSGDGRGEWSVSEGKRGGRVETSDWTGKQSWRRLDGRKIEEDVEVRKCGRKGVAGLLKKESAECGRVEKEGGLEHGRLGREKRKKWRRVRERW